MNAIYAGSFDPFTNGHMEVLRQAVPLFDKITVLFAENPAKSTRFNCNPIMWSLRQMMPDVDFELQVPGTMLTDDRTVAVIQDGAGGIPASPESGGTERQVPR